MVGSAVLLSALFSLVEAADIAVLPDPARSAEVLFLGENHDNPVHHAVQAAWVAALRPKAIVFEMLTEEQVARITPALRRDKAALEAALRWEEAGWPDFEMYFPIFAAAPEARIIAAAVPRERLGALMAEDLAVVAGPEITARFDLDTPLAAQDQAAREALQGAAHCDALPDDLLPRMVERPAPARRGSGAGGPGSARGRRGAGGRHHRERTRAKRLGCACTFAAGGSGGRCLRAWPVGGGGESRWGFRSRSRRARRRSGRSL